MLYGKEEAEMNKIDRFEVSFSSADHSAEAVDVFVKEFQAKGFWVCLSRSFVQDGVKFWVVSVQW